MPRPRSREAGRDRHLEWAGYGVERLQTDPDGRPVTLSTYPLDHLAAEVRACLHWSVSAGRVREGLRLSLSRANHMRILRAMWEQDSLGLLRRVRVPTLVVAARRDTVDESERTVIAAKEGDLPI